MTSETCIYGILHDKHLITTYSLNQDLLAIICYMITFLEHIIKYNSGWIYLGNIFFLYYFGQVVFLELGRILFVFKSIWNAVSFEI